MQLPPTILSLNNNKKKQDPVSAKATGKKTPAQKAKVSSKEKSAAPDPPPDHIPQDEDHTADPSEESDEEGDVMMKDDDEVPPLADETGTEAEIPSSGGSNPSTVKTPCRGALVPPRTLETTLFDRLEKMYGPGIKRLLNVQYRYEGYVWEFSSP